MQLYYAIAMAEWPSVVCMWMAARYRDGQTASLPVVPPAAAAAISVTHASVRRSVGRPYRSAPGPGLSGPSTNRRPPSITTGLPASPDKHL